MNMQMSLRDLTAMVVVLAVAVQASGQDARREQPAVAESQALRSGGAVAAVLAASSGPVEKTPGEAGASAAFGVSPANDICSNAQVVVGFGQIPFDTSSATADGLITAACTFFGTAEFDADLWYCLAAPQTGPVIVETCGPTAVDTRLAVYDACGPCPPDDSRIIACSDDNCDLQTRIEFSATAGQSYLIRVGVFPGAALGPGTLSISAGVEVSPCPSSVSCQLADAQGHGGVLAATSDRNPSANFRVAESIRARQGGFISAVCWWGVYFDFATGGPCGPGPDNFEITYYNDDAGGEVPGTLRAGPFVVVADRFATGRLLPVAGIPEQQYQAFHPPVFIAPSECLWVEITNNVGGNCYWLWQTAPAGDARSAQSVGGIYDATAFDLAVCLDVSFASNGCQQNLRPQNDACRDAEFVTALPFATTGSTRFATGDAPPATTCGTPVSAPGVWYSFLGDGTTVTITTCGVETDYDTQLNVYCGPCNSLICVAGNDDDPSCGGNAQASRITLCTQIGVVYRVLVQGFGGAVGDFSLEISSNGVACAPAPPTCPPCTLSCPGGSVPEFEACGGDNNGGCDSVPSRFQTINCGQTVCGTAFASGGVRDTDWYTFNIPGPGTFGVSWTVQAEFPAVVALLRVTSCSPPNFETLSIFEAEPCEPTAAAAVLGPGTYVAFVAPGRIGVPLLEGYPCGFQDRYFGTLSCLPSPTACEPLDAPWFCIDSNSLRGDLSDFSAADILQIPGPSIAIPAQNLGLLFRGDELDALSFDNSGIGPGQSFLLRFGVNRSSTGGPPPDPEFAGLGLPYNVQHQAARRQAAADEYVSLTLFNRSGPLQPFGGGAAENNTKTRNQSDAGGVDFYLEPEIGPDDSNAGGESDVSGETKVPPATLGPPQYIFFSLRRGSASLDTLPGTGSAADVYVDNNINAPGGEVLYVAPAQIGLLPNDDLDALIVLDNGDRVFTPGQDQVIFSLAAGSPSLGAGAPRSPADLFRSNGGGVFNLYATAQNLGLAVTDELDALEFSLCGDVLDCVQRWGIGFVSCGGCPGGPGDANCDGTVDFFDIDAFLLALFDAPGYLEVYCGGSLCAADANCSGNVDFFDIDAFLACLFSSCPPCP